MKIKADFITNSSSSAYIIVENTPASDLELDVLAWKNGIKNDGHLIKDYQVFEVNDIDEVKTYNNNGKPLDWIQEITGIKWGELGDCYDQIVERIKNGQTVHYIEVERGEVDLEELTKDYDVQIIWCEEY